MLLQSTAYNFRKFFFQIYQYLFYDSAYNFRKKDFQIYQYFFYDYHLVYILATMWDTATSISNSAVFLQTVLDPLKQSKLDFSNTKQIFVRIQLLEIDYGRSLFSDSFVPNASKTFGTPFPYYDWFKTTEV